MFKNNKIQYLTTLPSHKFYISYSFNFLRTFEHGYDNANLYSKYLWLYILSAYY